MFCPMPWSVLFATFLVLAVGVPLNSCPLACLLGKPPAQGLADLSATVLSELRPKTFKGTATTGPLLADLLEQYVDAVNKDSCIVVGSLWQVRARIIALAEAIGLPLACCRLPHWAARPIGAPLSTPLAGTVVDATAKLVTRSCARLSFQLRMPYV